LEKHAASRGFLATARLLCLPSISYLSCSRDLDY